ncbi:MAG: hypothetical protein Q8Q59_15780 [Luteolibacter sp.]|nr:hypothetical protein [Luteolibacter sp.]
METSLYQIDLIPRAGASIRLLDAGDLVTAPLEFTTGQMTADHRAIDGNFGKTAALPGSLRQNLEWTRIQEHASHGAAESYCAWTNKVGHGDNLCILRVSIPGGQIWDLHDIAFTGVTCRRERSGTHATATTYRVEVGISLPVEGLPFYCGIPHRWDLLAHAKRFINHDGSLPDGILPLPPLQHRITDDHDGVGAERRFEVGFNVPELLVGSAATGWTDANHFIRLDLQRSEDLVTWTEGEMIDCAATAIPVGDGTYDYWARLIHPVDSAVKTGQLVCASTAADGNVNNNPFQGITLNGVALALPNAPYTMPTHAAVLQADLVALGFTGATVSASSATVWAVTIPNVRASSFGMNNEITWTSYLSGTDPLGGNVYSAGRSFAGAWVNSAGTRTFVQKQFARLRYTITPQCL